MIRWGATPLQDAVAARHPQMASFVRTLGGTMPETFAADQLFTAAVKGHVKDLNMLIKFAGLDVR